VIVESFPTFQLVVHFLDEMFVTQNWFTCGEQWGVNVALFVHNLIAPARTLFILADRFSEEN